MLGVDPRDNLRFLRQFLGSPRAMGAIVPSSGKLGSAMTCGMTVPSDRSVVELGPGTGAITRHLLSKLEHPAQYLGIEREPAFVELLRKRFPGAAFHQGLAERLERLMAEADVAPPRYIISGLPFTNLPLRSQYRVIAALRRVLPRDAEFRTFQYLHSWRLPSAVRFRRRMDEFFGPDTRAQFVMVNVPPARVLAWRGSDFRPINGEAVASLE